MADNTNPPIAAIAPANAAQSLTIQYARRTLTMHSVSGTELDTIASLNNSVHLAFVGISFGAFLALLITIFTVPIADPRVFSAFVASTALSGVLSGYFGIRAYSDYQSAKQKLKEVKQDGLRA